VKVRSNLKCLNRLIPDYLALKFAKHSESHYHNTRWRDDKVLLLCKTSTGQRPFFYHASKTWNSVMDFLKSTDTLCHFKRVLRTKLRL